jgi:hypothetical protein
MNLSLGNSMKILFTFILFFFCIAISAQDTLITTMGKKIPVKLIKVGKRTIEYYDPSYPNGPSQKVDTYFISEVRYANGYKETINSDARVFHPKTPEQKEKEKEEKQEVEKLNDDENSYYPFHQTIPDSMNKPVSKFGHYVYLGVGEGAVSKFNYTGAAGMLSYTIAYKSHLFSLTGGGIHKEDSPIRAAFTYIPYATNVGYYGLLFGESIRGRHHVLAISTGVQYMDIHCYQQYEDMMYTSSGTHSYFSGYKIFYSNQVDYRGLAIPITVNAFFLAKNKIGFGFYLSTSIMPATNNHTTTLALCLVFGHWNNTTGNK